MTAVTMHHFSGLSAPFVRSKGTVSGGVFKTALENQLDPYRYLTWLLKMANGTDLTRPDILQSLLPWKAPETCKVK